MYRVVDATLIRTVAQQSSLDIPPWPDIAGDDDDQVVEHLRHWLRQVWAIEPVAAAIEVASPSLARRVHEVCHGRTLPARQVRRAVLSVVRYLLRATNRPTPFGLFAGVAPARFGRELHARFGDQHHGTARVDAEWLPEMINRLEACSELRRRLPVVVHNLAFVRDGRLVVGCQRQPGDSNATAPAEVSVRCTRAVDTVRQAARSPIAFADLIDKLSAEFPETPQRVIETMLAELVTQRLLITSLHPPMTATHPLDHVLDELAAVDAAKISEIAELVQQLRNIHGDLSRHNQALSPADQRDLRISLAEKMNRVVASEQPVSIDLRVDSTVILPHAVAREAEAAADALVRLTPHPSGSTAWQDYHSQFLERYGMAAMVPVLQLLDGDAGLGYPAGYRDARRDPPPASGVSERDESLLVLAQQAALDKSLEVVLDEATIAHLAADDAAAVQPHTELRFSVDAPTPDALNRGEFGLAVAGVSRASGTTTGRFLDLFAQPDWERMAAAYRQLPTVHEDAIPVQVSCPTLHTRAENVARSPVVLSHLVSAGEHHRPGVESIPLDDLAVTGDAEHLYLMSLSRRRPVEPVVFSAVEFTHAAHPLLRFLCEITTARAAACTPFSWGVASRLPFLPRVRYGRTVLSPARWTMTASDLPGPDAPQWDWAERLTAWRRQYSVPASVYLGDDDRRLRLNLDEPAHQHLLRADLDRTGHLTLRETPEANASGWCNSRAHEIVVPLAANQPHRTRRPQRPRTASTITTGHGHLPGEGDWLYLKLYGHPDRHNAILTTHLPRLLATWDRPPEWWFLRYQDRDPHLRLRIRLPNADAFGDTAQRVGTWTAGLRRRGLIGHVQLDTYYPEAGRFGEGDAMTAAESVFAADSAAAITQLTALGHDNAPHPHAVIAASLVDLAIAFTGAADDGMRWLIDHVPKTSTPALAQNVRDQAIGLANPRDHGGILRALPGGDHVVTAWARRRSVLTTYRDALVRSGDTRPEAILPDLAHLHVVRMAGLSPDTERTCTRLARAAALSWTTRSQGAQ